jgi:hypothetical protein
MSGKIIVGLVLVALLVYGAVEAAPLILGPLVTLDSPQDHETVPGGIVTISGHAKRATTLTLDGVPVLGDEKGGFSSTLAFPTGTSILTLTAKDRFGRTISIIRTIYVP